jgi:aconitate hydratase
VTTNSFGTRGRLDLAGITYNVHRMSALPGVERLPMSTKIILENLLRHENGDTVTADQIQSVLEPSSTREEIAFLPSRIFMHDTNGVPLLTDLAALRDAVEIAGGDGTRVNPIVPGELTVDHSVSTDFAGRAGAHEKNIEIEYVRNAERYRFLKWGSRLDGMTVIPPGGGIMHQINVERLARVVERRDGWAFPDTCLGTDSHTTMVNGLGVLGWGIGGVEAESALLGLPISILVPPVVGVELLGSLPAGVTATDLVLTITQRLRAHGVVGKIVEFFGAGLPGISVETRTTISNMAPEYGATSGLFPVDAATLDYLRLTGRDPGHVGAVETYCKEQLLWLDTACTATYDERVSIVLDDVEPSLAGPRRPQDRVSLPDVRTSFHEAVASAPAATSTVPHGSVAIASITSCTNTSNPEVMVAAGLLARNAHRLGLRPRPWVKTSMAPGSKAVTSYLGRAGLDQDLDALGFQVVGYGCMTCIGNSGELLPVAAEAVRDGSIVASVLSGNRNFDGRINNDVGLNYLASPPLVVAYALAGTVDCDLTVEPLGRGPDGAPVYLSDIWPSDEEIGQVIRSSVEPDMYTVAYERLLTGDERWAALAVDNGARFAWHPDSTYVQRPPFLDGVGRDVPDTNDILGARVLAHLGDSVTTDHISPAGRIPANSLAGRYLVSRGVLPQDLNTYASRRGNFEVMTRGGFSNPKLRNRLVPDASGGLTRDADGAVVAIYDAAQSFARSRTPLVVIGGTEYGSGSSRDWAAKVTSLLGVKAVLAQSFERIHRSNLVQMGVLPLELVDGTDLATIGEIETLDVVGVERALRPQSRVLVRVQAGGRQVEFEALARIDTSREADYFRHGGILPFVLRRLLAS